MPLEKALGALRRLGQFRPLLSPGSHLLLCTRQNPLQILGSHNPRVSELSCPSPPSDTYGIYIWQIYMCPQDA